MSLNTQSKDGDGNNSVGSATLTGDGDVSFAVQKDAMSARVTKTTAPVESSGFGNDGVDTLGSLKLSSAFEEGMELAATAKPAAKPSEKPSAAATVAANTGKAVVVAASSTAAAAGLTAASLTKYQLSKDEKTIFFGERNFFRASCTCTKAADKKITSVQLSQDKKKVSFQCGSNAYCCLWKWTTVWALVTTTGGCVDISKTAAQAPGSSQTFRAYSANGHGCYIDVVKDGDGAVVRHGDGEHKDSTFVKSTEMVDTTTQSLVHDIK